MATLKRTVALSLKSELLGVSYIEGSKESTFASTSVIV